MIMKKFFCVCFCIFCFAGLAPETHAGPDLKWYSFKDYADQGNSGGKKIYIHFWAAWCRYCDRMERETFSNRSVIAALNKEFYPIKVNTDQEPLVAGMFGVRGLPSNLFLTEKGKILAHRPGFMSPKTFMKILRSVNNR